MSELSESDICKIADGVNEHLDKKAEAFYIDREKHWKHHDFLDKVIEFFSETKGFVWKAFVLAGLGFVFMIFALGFAIWSKGGN